MIPSFRIWDKIDKEIIHVDGIDFEQKTVRTADVIVPFAECVLMQSTGLFDKNGVEIFEGDVVKDDETPKEIYICRRSDCSPRLELQSKDKFILMNLFENDVKNLEVIGNIYENPELAEVRDA